MKRRIFTLLTICMAMSIQFAGAQYYYNAFINEGPNPGGLNEDVTFPLTGSNPPPGWTIVDELSAQTSPKWSNQIQLPFTFNFNDSDYTHVKVANAGVVTFTDVADTNVVWFGNSSLPFSDIPDNSICVLGITPNWSDGNQYARVGTKTFGSAPNRQFWITFNSYGGVQPPAPNNAFFVFSIVLEESTNHVYITDQRAGNGENARFSFGIQLDNSTAIPVAGSPTLRSHSTVSATANANTYYKFIQGTRPQYDVNLREFIAPSHVAIADGGAQLSAVIRNFGSATLSSLTVEYEVDGTIEASETISISNLSTNNEVEIDHPTLWQPSQRGSYTVKFILTDPNGEQDANPDDNSLSADIMVEEEFAVRRVLVETFTSSTCPPCRPGAERLEEAFSILPDDHFTALRYQVNWPGVGDPYYTMEVNNRRNDYGVTGAPSTSLDGGPLFNPGGFSGQAIANGITQSREVPSLVAIEGSAKVSGQEITYDFDIIPYTDLPSGLRLHTVISEKETYKNVMTNGQTEFHNVMKKMIPNHQGEALPALTLGQEFSKSGAYEFKGSYRLPSSAGDPINHNTEHSVENFGNLELIVFVQDNSTREILQSFRTDIGFHSSVDELAGKKDGLTVYPNPATNLLNLRLENGNQAEVVLQNLNGQVIYKSNENFNHGNATVQINTSDLAAGVYLVRVTDERNTVAVRKVVIQ
jgi:hypothetical protein